MSPLANLGLPLGLQLSQSQPGGGAVRDAAGLGTSAGHGMGAIGVSAVGHKRIVSYIDQSQWLLQKAHFLSLQLQTRVVEDIGEAQTVPILSTKFILPTSAGDSFPSIVNCSDFLPLPLYNHFPTHSTRTISNNIFATSDSLSSFAPYLCALAMSNSTAVTAEEVYKHQWSLVFSPVASAVIAFFVLLCSILTFGGNLLVFIAFFIEKKLQITNNYFLLSLAVADGCVGLISVNVWLLMYLGKAYWPFGWTACVSWIFCDYVWCTTSIYHVFIISIDRYWSVSKPANYRTKMNPRMALIMIIPTWVVSIVWWMALIVGHPLIVGNLVIDGMCYANYWGIGLWTYLSTSITYWIPLVVITTLYIHIYRIAKKMKKKRKLKSEMIRRQLVTAAKATSAMQKLRQAQIQDPKPDTSPPPAQIQTQHQNPDVAEPTITANPLAISDAKIELDPQNSLVKLSRQIANGAENKTSTSLAPRVEAANNTLGFPAPNRSSAKLSGASDTSTLSPDSCFNEPVGGAGGRETNAAPKTLKLKTSFMAQPNAGELIESSSSSRGGDHTPMPKASSASLKKMESVIRIIKTSPNVKRLVKKQSNDKKAMRTLTFLLGAFILCWTPWNIAEVVNGIWGADTVNAHLYQFTWFLTYFNSALNPLCYAFANTLYKDTFIRILTCGKIKPVSGGAQVAARHSKKDKAKPATTPKYAGLKAGRTRRTK